MCHLLSSEGYWVTQAFKVDLSKEEKKLIGRASSPRWEIDVLAYNPRQKELLILECKSFIDSVGVQAAQILSHDESGKSRYKLFVDKVLRETVFKVIKRQLVKLGMITDDTRLVLGLAAGRMKSKQDEDVIIKHFELMGWRFYSPDWIKTQLKKRSESGYFDSVADVVAKILLREK